MFLCKDNPQITGVLGLAPKLFFHSLTRASTKTLPETSCIDKTKVSISLNDCNQVSRSFYPDHRYKQQRKHLLWYRLK